MKTLSFLIASFLVLTATSTDATGASTIINLFSQKKVPKELQDKPQKEFQKHSQKHSNNGEQHGEQHRADKYSRKVVRSEKTVNVVQQNPHQNMAEHTGLSPFSRTHITVIKQRNVKMFQNLPNGYSNVIFGGQNFYHYGGRYYGYSGNMYTIIGAPIGIRVRLLPVGHRRILIGGVPHFYYSGVYYRDIGNSEYEVVEPTIGTIVPELPDENVEEVMIDGQKLYEYDNILYKNVMTKFGTEYEVVGKLGV
jgi:Family of unknown function (DUF6515)